MSRADSTMPQNGWLSCYAELTNLMYTVRRCCPRLVVLATSTVQPRHPIPPDQLELLGMGARRGAAKPSGIPGPPARESGCPSLAVMAAHWLRCVLFACRDTLSLLVLKLRFRLQLERLRREPALIVMKTWCFGPESLSRTADFYYGTLPHQLQERGVSCVVLCGDTRGRVSHRFARSALAISTFRAVPELLLVPVWAPLVTTVRQWMAALWLRRAAKRAEDSQFARLCASACLGSLQTITLRNTLQFYIARSAVRMWRAQVCITLYEGQPWEQPAWHGAKAANPRCLTVGYQHTIVMAHSLGLLSPNHDSWELSAPDIVLCLGDVPRRMMSRGHRPERAKLVTFGTFRRAANPAQVQLPQPARRTVLVLPEGNLTESRLLFNFAMQAAALAPDHRVIFRCHPLLPFDQVQSHLQERPARFANIEISRRASITEDFDRSSLILYRGSSAVLYAVLHGLKPLYVHDRDHPDIDPLFEVDGWRERVSSPEEMAQALRRYIHTHDDTVAQTWRPVVEYVSAYTIPVDEAAIDRFLGAVGLAAQPAAEEIEACRR